MSTEEFNYFISEKGALLVVSFVGALTKATAESLKKCQSEVEKKRPMTFVVVSLHDVTTLDYGGIAAFTRFQKAIRDRSAQLRICFVNPDNRKLLEERGSIRSLEICGSLLDALKSLGLTNDGQTP